ncbi:MAG: hypothetical protein EOM20_10665 [Spartobacteria bacterium]|nr:hypothetical protein [Spartobacteria bacterium]
MNNVFDHHFHNRLPFATPGNVALRAWLAFLLFTSLVGAQITTPLHIGATSPILDEFREPLCGDCYHPGDVVQVLWASNGIAYPPAIDGAPAPENPLMAGGLTGIGHCVIPSLVDSGLFGLSIAQNRPGNGSKIFVRVFNDSALDRVSFYGDSHIFTVQDNQVFDVGVVATTNALDTADNDNDNLNNSWERSYLSDPSNPDSDGDGVRDGDEVLAGTDLLDASCVFELESMQPIGAHDLYVEWKSIAGHQYIIQFTADTPDHHLSYQDVSPTITATDTISTTIITNALLLGKGCFRVMHVE